MIFAPGYRHYLSYGATDQQTMTRLSAYYHGLIVPGTVAAFQREGTGGFVLSLSATQAGTPYAIDPRFPLFQQHLLAAKKSHRALADLFSDPALVSDSPPAPEDFTDERIDRVAAAWVAFNEIYESAQSTKFDKYAQRLGETVQPTDATAPSEILAPYLVADSPDDPWWHRSLKLCERTVAHATTLPVRRVVACQHASQLDALIKDVDDDHIVVWVSGLNEINAAVAELTAYGQAISTAHGQGRAVFALYGGFFALTLSGVGLGGAAHGVGYGESRAWEELPQSGPPPARYYLPRVHRYVGQDLAFAMWSARPQLTRCGCVVCNGGPPPSNYHDLMAHSVLARAAEIETYAGLAPADTADMLDDEFDRFRADLVAARLPRPLQAAAERSFEHLPRWVHALRNLSSP